MKTAAEKIIGQCVAGIDYGHTLGLTTGKVSGYTYAYSCILPAVSKAVSNSITFEDVLPLATKSGNINLLPRFNRLCTLVANELKAKYGNKAVIRKREYGGFPCLVKTEYAGEYQKLFERWFGV